MASMNNWGFAWSFKPITSSTISRKEICDPGCGIQHWGRRRADVKWTVTGPTTKSWARKRVDSDEHENQPIMQAVDQPVRIHPIHVYRHTSYTHTHAHAHMWRHWFPLFWMVLTFIRKVLPTRKITSSKHLGQKRWEFPHPIGRWQSRSQ